MGAPPGPAVDDAPRGVAEGPRPAPVEVDRGAFRLRREPEPGGPKDLSVVEAGADQAVDEPQDRSLAAARLEGPGVDGGRRRGRPATASPALWRGQGSTVTLIASPRWTIPKASSACSSGMCRVIRSFTGTWPVEMYSRARLLWAGDEPFAPWMCNCR